MTISEAHIEFKTRLDKIDALEYPNFLPEEIDLILNNAQDRYVKQRYGKTNVKRTSFEEEQKRTEDLRGLIRAVYSAPTLSLVTNVSLSGSNVELEDDHFILIWESAIINCSTCNQSLTIPNISGGAGRTEQIEGIEVEVRPITHNEYSTIRNDPFKGPDQTKILRLMYDNYIELIPSSDCSVVYYIYRYIKYPERVSITNNITFELADHTHTEIIDVAIQVALENIEAKRGQSFDKIINTNE